MLDPNSYQAIGWACLILVAIATGINQVMGIVDRLKEKPTPSETYMKKVDCDRNHDGIGKRVDRLEGELALIRSEMKADRQMLNDAAEKRSDELKAHISVTLSRVHERVDRILEGMANSKE